MVCRSFSEKKQISDAATKGVAKIAAETFVKETKVVKKNNFKDHLTKSFTHTTAVLRLTDDLSRTEHEKKLQQVQAVYHGKQILRLLFSD